MSLYDDDGDDGDDDESELGLGGVIAALWSWVRPHKVIAGLLVVTLGAHLLATLAIALSLEVIFDEVIPAQNAGQLASVMAVVFAILAAAMVAAMLQSKLVARLSSQVLIDVQSALFDRVLRVPPSYFDKTERGDILARFSTDVASIASAVGQSSPALVMYGLMLGGCIAAIAWIDWRAALGTLVLFPLGALMNRLMGGRTMQATRNYKAGEGQILSTAEEAIRGQIAIRGFGLQPFFRKRFDARATVKRAAHVRASFLVHLSEMIAEYGSMMLVAMAIGGGAWMALAGFISPGSLVAIFTLLFYIQDAVYEVTSSAAALLEAAGGLERVEEFLREEAEDETDSTTQLARLGDEIRFENVAFAYPGTTVLFGFSLSLKRGQSVALVGRSGSGKSTVLKLLMRFLDPAAGNVTWDGVDITNVSRASVRAQLGVVFQEPLMIRATVGETIRFGRPDATDAEVDAAIAAAAFHQVVAELPEGLDTMIGDGAHGLSGGQKQRLAFAQAILRNASVLVLDEVTSALDPETETKIAETLDRLPAGQTVISVTHRLNLAKKADRIVVMDGGRIVEDGAHDDLLAADGLYARMYEHQSGFTVGEGGEISVSPAHLKRVPLLSGVSEEHLAQLAGAFIASRFEQDAMIVAEGDRADAFYLVYRGRLEVRSQGKVVGYLSDGDYFGEVALLFSLPRTATVTALTPVTCLRLDRTDFAGLLSSGSGIEHSMFELARQRVSAQDHPNELKTEPLLRTTSVATPE